MVLTSLFIQNLRIIKTLELSFSPGLNFLIGENGAGKTSILEAIAFLSTGRSFRSRQLNTVVMHGKEEMIIRGVLSDKQEIGLVKRLNGQHVTKLNHALCLSQSELARQIPYLLINHETHALVSGPALLRRQYLDWLVFHVEHAFYPIWKQYQNALKQRNAALRQRQYKQAQAWDPVLVHLAEAIHRFREHCFVDIHADLQSIYTLFSDLPIEMHYYAGWAKDLSFEKALKAAWARDCDLGYTSVGPHRANCLLTQNKLPVSLHLSRGQEKILAVAMVLTQGLFYKRNKHKSPLFLLDDLMSELDEKNQEKIVNYLQSLDAQIILAQPYLNANSPENASVFHVEQC